MAKKDQNLPTLVKEIRGQLALSQEELARKLEELEKRYQFKVVIKAIQELMKPPAPENKQAYRLCRG